MGLLGTFKRPDQGLPWQSSKTPPSNVGGADLIPGWGVKIPHASWPKKPKHKTEAIL